MRSYNPKEWGKIVFDFHKSDTLRKLIPVLLCVALYAYVVAFLEKMYVPAEYKELIKSLSVTHTLLGFVISLLMVFRTNTAYDRWWEGRRQWGTLVNVSRSLAIKLQAILPE